jgi:hypothetical protein
VNGRSAFASCAGRTPGARSCHSMRALFAKIATAVLLSCATSFAQSTFVFRQLPTFNGSALFSDGVEVRWADDFRLSRSATIRSAVWWGTASGVPGNFSLTLYEDEGGRPGSVIPASFAASWQVDDGLSHVGAEFQYVGVLQQPVELKGATRYWLSITHPPYRSWDWTGSTPPGNAAVQNKNLGGEWMIQPLTGGSFALSTDVPEPAALLLLLVGVAFVVLYACAGGWRRGERGA